MKKAAKAVYNWFGRCVINVWLWPAALRVILKDYVPHCMAWNLREDDAYFDANEQYWCDVLYEMAVQKFPKSWIDSMDEHHIRNYVRG